MTEKDLSRVYRDSSREEPRAEIDAAILAAARRQVKAKPRRFATRSWGIPLSAAAVLLVSATLTLLVLEEPDRPMTPPAASEDKALARPDQSLEKLGDLKEDASAPTKESAQREPSARFETRAKSVPAEPAATATPEVETQAIAGIEEDVPDKWLARIETLRAEGHTEEAKKNLARFKERYPDYVLPAWAKQ